MEENSNYKILSGSGLKMIAMATMMVSHIGYFLTPHFSAEMQRGLFLVGRPAFPIFLFLMVEGYRHTRSRLRYALTLLAFALLSEPVWNLACYGECLANGKHKVLFTLFLDLLAVWTVDRGFNWVQGCWMRMMLRALALVVLFCINVKGNLDYAISGMSMALVYYVLGERHKLVRVVLGYYYAPGAALTCLYSGKKGWIGASGSPVTRAIAKYAMYVFYPVHIVAIVLIRKLVFE